MATPVSENCRVFVSGLPRKPLVHHGDSFIEKIFGSAADQVTSAQWTTDKQTGRFYGSGFVHFKTPEAARSAVASSSGKQVSGCAVKVGLARSRSKSTDEVTPRAWSLRIPDSIVATVSVKSSEMVTSLAKRDKSIVYVGLFGLPVEPSQRFAVMNALDNYFHIFGKIRDIGRLKHEYSYLGDYFVVFEKEADAVFCSRHHAEDQTHALVPSIKLGIPSYQMKIW